MRPGPPRILAEYAHHTALGMQLAANMGLPIWLGWWLDTRYGWSPVGLLLGVLVGFILVMGTVYKAAVDSRTKPKK